MERFGPTKMHPLLETKSRVECVKNTCVSMALRFLLYISIIGIVLGGTWDYHDQENWHLDAPECSKDRDESPINVIEKNAIIDSKKCIPRFEWQINETHNKFAIINSNEVLTVVPVDADHNKLTRPIAKFPNYFHPTNKNLSYCLDSFHFHWGLEDDVGSEHAINSKSYPLEAHFVHYSCAYKNVSHAFDAYSNALDDHILAVVAVLFELSEKDNEMFDVILSDDVLPNILYPNATYVDYHNHVISEFLILNHHNLQH